MRSDFPGGVGVGVAEDAVAGDAEDERWKVRVEGAAGAHVGDFGGDGGGVVAVHEVGVALGGDEVFGGFGLAAGVEGGAAGGGEGLGGEEVLRLRCRACPTCEKRPVFAPAAARRRRATRRCGRSGRRARRRGGRSVWPRRLPPGGDDVEGEAAAGDAVDVGGLLGEQGGGVEGGADGGHELELCGDGGEGGGGGPGVERVGFGALDVVEVELGDEGEIEADLLRRGGRGRGRRARWRAWIRLRRCEASRRRRGARSRSA